MIALVAPSRNPFFAHFIAKFQRCVWEHDALLLYVEARSIRRWRIACTGFTAKISAMLSYGRMTGAWIRKSFCVSGASA